MKPFRTTVTGSFPRPVQPTDTLKKPTLTRAEADETIRWAVKEQCALGLDIVTDGEGRRENMYYFFQKRLDGISFDEMEYRKYGPLGFGIEIAKVTGRIENPRFELTEDYLAARSVAPKDVEVKITCTGPHMLAKFSNNARKDLYPDDRALAMAYVKALRPELESLVKAGCTLIQFDEPGWTAFPEEAVWGAEVLNELTKGLKCRIGLHVCCGNARRKRAYVTKYQDLTKAFQALKLDQAVLEHCTLSYDMMPLWKEWPFKGEFAVGVCDQRSDTIEPPEEIVRRAEPALKYFPPERLLLTSECGFQHVPLDVTRAKLKTLVEGAKLLRTRGAKA